VEDPLKVQAYMPSPVFFKIQYASEANSTNHSKHFSLHFLQAEVAARNSQNADKETHDEI
jgi:hypothetical protein